MDEHQQGRDDDAVGRALRTLARSGPPADAAALVAGARSRARTLRRRRRVAAGIVAVVALAVPVGVSQLTPDAAPRRTVVASPAPSPVVVTEDDLLTGASIAGVLPGAVRDRAADVVETAGADVVGGVCRDLPLPAGPRLLAGRTATWNEPLDPTRVGQPSLRETVRVFEGSGAQAYLEFAKAQAQACAGQSAESGPWTVDDQITDGVEVQAYALLQAAPQAFWTVRVVDARGPVVVDLQLSAFAGDPRDLLLGQVSGLATAALEQNAGAVG
ncbi:sensor domain-containing protein [Kineococcus rubinsiae]|uniref:sensor domain-containing protein n=1 Tax=Kineococcus rubinsiae TaxID=2609562 RepID=UPI001431B08B|nr:sensor domain-containing protein [Kineococcus rubinsiae]NIZ92069.1 sensor domain-containing protein [Kineococcus rubinsiae]